MKFLSLEKREKKEDLDVWPSSEENEPLLTRNFT